MNIKNFNYLQHFYTIIVEIRLKSNELKNISNNNLRIPKMHFLCKAIALCNFQIPIYHNVKEIVISFVLQKGFQIPKKWFTEKKPNQTRLSLRPCVLIESHRYNRQSRLIVIIIATKVAVI